MAREAGLSLKEYWDQIIEACYLDKNDSKKEWIKIRGNIFKIQNKLNILDIDKSRIEGIDADLWISLGEKRRWRGGTGSSIPSFEVFTSPDWRGANSWIRFNQPLYARGNLISDINLEFKDGIIAKIKAKKNEKLSRALIKIEGGIKQASFLLPIKDYRA